MLTRLTIQNFKAHRDLEVDLAPLTLIVGVNNSGKSSLLEAIVAVARGYTTDKSSVLLHQMKNSQSKIGVTVTTTDGISTEIIRDFAQRRLSVPWTYRAYQESTPGDILTLKSSARHHGLPGKFSAILDPHDLPDSYQLPRYQALRCVVLILKELLEQCPVDPDEILKIDEQPATRRYNQLMEMGFVGVEIADGVIVDGAKRIAAMRRQSHRKRQAEEYLFRSWAKQEDQELEAWDKEMRLQIQQAEDRLRSFRNKAAHSDKDTSRWKREHRDLQKQLRMRESEFQRKLLRDRGSVFESATKEHAEVLITALKRYRQEDARKCDDLLMAIQESESWIELGELRRMVEEIGLTLPKYEEITRGLWNVPGTKKPFLERRFVHTLRGVRQVRLEPFEKRFFGLEDDRPSGKQLKLLSRELDNWGLPNADVRMKDEDELGNSELIIETDNVQHNLADLGRGARRMIPLFFSAGTSGSVNLVEEPEAHLHQKAQAELGDLFLRQREGPGSDTQWLIETHSPHLIFRILRRIRETKNETLPAKKPRAVSSDITILCLEPTAGKGPTVRKLRISDDGQLLDPLPPDFFETSLSDRGMGWPSE
ncbi:MAG: hypothetical protein CMM12_01695 [Rhodospirillaceae bacterium]|nr:hypothetical protein [Rhodospirillaceae bacterium]